VNTGRPTELIRFRGMNEADIGGPQDPTWARYVENMERLPNGMWRTMPGATQAFDLGEGGGAVIGLFWFQPRPNQRFLVVERNDTDSQSIIEWVRVSDGFTRTIATRSRVPARPSASRFMQHDRWLYHFNGLDQPIRWDGSVVQPVGFAGVTPSPTVAGPGQGFTFADACAADLDDPPGLIYVRNGQRGVGELPDTTTATLPWRYYYGLTMVNDLGQESPMSPLAMANGENSNVVVYTDLPNSGSQNPLGSVVLTQNGQVWGKMSVNVGIPALPKHVVKWRLWRTTNLADAPTSLLPELFLVDEFYGGGDCDYVDSTPDSDLGEAHLPSQVGQVPLGIKVAEFHHGSMWVAVDNFLYRSAPNRPEQFPAGNRYPVGSFGQILALWSAPRGLVICSSRGIYMAKGDPISGYRIETVSERVECVGPRAVSYVDSLGLVVLTTTGPVVVQGTLDDDVTTRVLPLGGIGETWARTVAPRGLANSVILHRPEVEEVWFHIPTMGEHRPSYGLVYHYGGGGAGWSIRPNWRFTSACTYQGRTWLGSWDTSSSTTQGVFVLTRAGLGLLIGGDVATPPDPSIPLSATYEEPYPTEDQDETFAVSTFYKNISGDAIKGIYESGNVSSPGRIVPQSVDLLMLLDGNPTAMTVQVRYDRRTHFQATNDEEWTPARHSEQADQDETQQRGVWNVSTWDADRMWTLVEPGFVRVPLPTEAQFEFQIRVMGLDISIGGMRVETDPAAPLRRREVA